MDGILVCMPSWENIKSNCNCLFSLTCQNVWARIHLQQGQIKTLKRTTLSHKLMFVIDKPVWTRWHLRYVKVCESECVYWVTEMWPDSGLLIFPHPRGYANTPCPLQSATEDLAGWDPNHNNLSSNSSRHIKYVLCINANVWPCVQPSMCACVCWKRGRGKEQREMAQRGKERAERGGI